MDVKAEGIVGQTHDHPQYNHGGEQYEDCAAVGQSLDYLL
jgi:hypothetical protein